MPPANAIDAVQRTQVVAQWHVAGARRQSPHSVVRHPRLTVTTSPFSTLAA